jgi:transcriptional regulator with XRE-family HTH domain
MLHPNNVKQVRKEKGFAQEEVAEKINIGLRAYQKIESGETKLDVERLQELAKVFNVSMLDLVKTEGNFNVEYINNNIGGISNKEVTINQNNPIEEIKAAYDIALKTKDELIQEQAAEILLVL